MRVLVTGGAGFIGSHIVDTLLRAGHLVHVVDNLSSGRADQVPSAAELHVGDVSDAEWMAEVLRVVMPDAVSHQAAQISVVRSVLDPAFDARQNVLGVISLLEAARRLDPMPKIIFASSGGAIYGDPEAIPVTEEAPIRPASQYGLTKAIGEQYLSLYARLYGLPFTALRYANVFGPRQSCEGEAGVCAIFTSRALANEPMQIFGDGTQSRDYVYVEDVARANLLALTRANGAFLNIGTGVQTSTQTVFDTIRDATGYGKPVVYAAARAGEVQAIALDCRRAWEQLSWRPGVTFEEGIGYTVDFYRSRRSGDGTLRTGTLSS